MFKALVSEFVLDWRLSGKAAQTAINYSKFLFSLAEFDSDPDLGSVKKWISKSESVSVRRKRGQSVRALSFVSSLRRNPHDHNTSITARSRKDETFLRASR